MQFKIWIDDGNYLIVSAKLQDAGTGKSADGPEVLAAAIVDAKLSNIESDELLDVVGQVVDHLTASKQPPASPQEDWRDLFRRGRI